MTPLGPGAVEYARRLSDEILGWYESADHKAQVILGLDGIFLTLLTTTLFSKPVELVAVVGSFSPLTWLLLGITIACLLISVANAVSCLRSRTYSASELATLIEKAEASNPDPNLYAPANVWFFQHIATLERDRLRRTLGRVDARFELDALTPHIHILAINVRGKHEAVNRGFLFATAMLIFFFLAGVSYALPLVVGGPS